LYITESTELSNWMERASLDGRYGIDIEFIRERTYYPQLALIQISVGSDLALLDPLGDVDLSPLIATVRSAPADRRALEGLQTRFVAPQHEKTLEHFLAGCNLLLFALFGHRLIEPTGTSFRDDQVAVDLLFKAAIRLVERLVVAYEDARHTDITPFR